MKKAVGIVAVTLIFCVCAVAGRKDEGDRKPHGGDQHAGAGNIPRHGPPHARVQPREQERGPAQPHGSAPARVEGTHPPETPDYRGQKGHPNDPHVYQTVGGSGTIAAVVMSDTTSTIPGSMGGSGVALAAVMSGG